MHRIRLDFPRITSADQLPAVYTQDPAAADFTERFLSLFDAAFEEADRAVERYPALLDPTGVPDEVLPWLGGLLGLAFDPGWDATTRRELLAAIPGLYRGRGTPAALSKAIRIVFGVDVAIHELFTDRDWAALNRASRLGATPAVRPVPGPVPGRRLGPVLRADPQLRQPRRRPADRPGQQDPGPGAAGTRARPARTWRRCAGWLNARHPRTRSPRSVPAGRAWWSACGPRSASTPRSPRCRPRYSAWTARPAPDGR